MEVSEKEIIEFFEKDLTEYFREKVDEVERIFYFSRNNFNGDKVQKVWNILKWVSENMDYDNELEESLLNSIVKGKGNCVNYSLLTAIMLKAHGIDTYFGAITYKNKESGHVVTIADIGDLFVLDQELPPYQIGNYAISEPEMEKMYIFSTNRFEIKYRCSFTREELMKYAPGRSLPITPKSDLEDLESALDEFLSEKYPWLKKEKNIRADLSLKVTFPKDEVHDRFFKFLLGEAINPKDLFPYSKYKNRVEADGDKITIYLELAK